MKRLVIVAGLLFTTGCPICPGEELRVVSGSVPVAPGATVEFEVQYGKRIYDSCDLIWYVNEIEGGDATVGFITDCGAYTAPTPNTLSSVSIYGAEHGLNCADCCPGAAREIALSASSSTLGAASFP